MKRWNTYMVALFVLMCVLLNYGGRQLAAALQLPLWLDSLGTVLCAYAGGPLCGVIVGVTGNMIYGIIRQSSWAYALTSVMLGVVVGIAARKKMLDSLFGTMSVSAVVALASVAISVPLNIMLWGGATGNVWGDGVIAYLSMRRFPALLSAVIGEFYIDFLDKVITLLALHAMIVVFRRMRIRLHGQPRHDAAEKAALALLLLMLVAIPALPARAEADEPVNYSDYVQTIYSSNNGLPCGEANDIAQTGDGLLWIGTYNGLYRYNGREFVWQDIRSVRNVNCLLTDDEGRLWIGTNDNGLSIVINERVSNVVGMAQGLPSDSVRSIIQSADGYYYIGTAAGMQVVTLNGGLKKVSSLWEVNHCEKSAVDALGHAAAVSSDGRLFLLKQGRILSSLQRSGENKEIYRCCAFAPDGRLLAGTSANHVDVFDVSDGGFNLVGVRDCEGLYCINNIHFVEQNKIFLTADNGVAYVDADLQYNLVNTNSFNSSIDNMTIDYQGNLWFTSSRLGLFRMTPSPFKDVYTAVGLESRVVNAVTRWNGCYYFGTDKGLDAVDGDGRIPVSDALTEALKGVRIRCLLTDSRGSMWICTYGSGLIEVEADGTQHLYNEQNGVINPRMRIAAELSDGSVVAGGNDGVICIRDHQPVWTLKKADGLSNATILSVMELADGGVLIGTDGGGMAVVRGGQIERTLTPDEKVLDTGVGLTSGVILRTERDPKSDGVFVVTSNGLCYMEPDFEIRPLTRFPYFNNYSIWSGDGDTLFVMGSAGIYVVNRDDAVADREDMRYELLDARRGLNGTLTANSFCYYDEGGLYLPCDRGVFVLDIERYASVSNRCRMTISAMKLDNVPQRFERIDPIEVPHDVSRVELSPEVLNYTIMEPYVGYMLEGFETDWTIVPQSGLGTIIYTNLPSGEYILRLAVFDNNRADILDERDFRLIKEKAIYERRGFMIYLLLVPMIAVAWLTWFIMRRQMQRALEIQEHQLELARQQIQMGNETVIAIAKAVDAKDERTSQHSLRVSEYSVMIAHELGFSDTECENLRRAALMHDIGKIGIPDSILNKPARLTDEEYAVMKSHVTRGAEILKDFTLIDHVVDGALHHHERYDGRGYPSNMKGEDIPLYGRIIGVADAFDAMTANRVYRKQMDFGYVLNEMRNGRGTQFDPKIVDILLSLIDAGKIDLNALYPPKPAEEQNTGGQP